MVPFGVVTEVLLGVSVLLGIASIGIIRPGRLLDAARNLRVRLHAVIGPLLVLGVTLVTNGRLRDLATDLSWHVGTNVTGYVYELEGNLVPFIQSFATPPLTAYFSFVYVIGYTFLLIFPVIAYLSVPHARPLRTLLIAYIANYLLGTVCYVVFIAYGPRNLIPELVESLLYTRYPQYQLLTAEVNTNTNVLPSLHSSLSVTVALLAARKRSLFPLWRPIAIVGAISVCLSTIYLGIHWFTDVVAGILLAVVAVRIASMDRWH